GSFALGLMCKPTLVMVPLVLLLLDYWPLDRFCSHGPVARRNPNAPQGRGYSAFAVAQTWRGLAVEKIPLFALSAAAAGATLWAHEKSIIQIEQIPFMWRVGNGLVTCLTYVKQ